MEKRPNISETFGSYIRRLRIKNNIGQRELANIIGVAPSYLNDIEKNKRTAPRTDLINKLSIILKANLNLLNDLAGNSKKTLPPDIVDFIEDNPQIVSLLRAAKNNKLSDDEIAMILVIAIGFGAMPGVLALGIHTMGFLAKFYAEDIEHVNKGPIEALKSSGASKRQIISFAIIPQIIPSFIANNLYIFDRNIRMATMLGIVGAGGIGYELQSSFRMFEYQKVSAIIVIIFITIFIIDHLSSFIRSKIN